MSKTQDDAFVDPPTKDSFNVPRMETASEIDKMDEAEEMSTATLEDMTDVNVLLKYIKAYMNGSILWW
jgi:hypothetical protein